MAKGGAYERDLAKFLSLWWTQEQAEPSDAVFWRTSNSGGRATVRGKKKTKNQYGDLCATDPNGQPFIDCFSVEIKRGYNKLTIQDLLEGGKTSKKVPSYENWVLQATASQLGSESLTWMIIHKRDKRNATITMPWTFTQYLSLYANLVIPNKIQHATLHVSSIGTLSTFRLSDFFDTVKPEHIKRIITCLLNGRKELSDSQGTLEKKCEKSSKTKSAASAGKKRGGSKGGGKK